LPSPIRKLVLGAAAIVALSAPAFAQEEPRYGARLEGFDYPHTVELFQLTAQGQPLEMAFMDVAPERPNGRTVVLLHGKNFCAATWEGTIARLVAEGFRVIAPDQIGFCKSSKPAAFQYSFHALAANTKALLDQRGVTKAIVVGHSMGGMLASRFALMYPEATEKLVMVNPLGLEDWKAKGVPYQQISQAFEGEKKTTSDTIKAYQQRVYYSGQWKPDYDRWVSMGAGMYRGPGGEAVTWSQALTSDMIFTQPVVYEFPLIQVPTVLFIGLTDKTAPGGNRAPKEIAATLGDYTRLGKQAAEAIPGAKLVEFADLGHSPQIQDPERFHSAFLEQLRD
jgi:pimeloyl-ACP methyl ester carboxylesterase